MMDILTGDLPGEGDRGDHDVHGDHAGDLRPYKTLPKMVEHVVLK